jgi:hypothetical protein
VRTEAFRASMRYLLGPRIAPAISWNPRTTSHTFLTFEQVRLAAAAAGLRIVRRLYADAGETALEACQANWRPAVRELAASPRTVPTVAESPAAINRHILPMERSPGTCSKYLTHRRSILTWAVRVEGRAARLLPMSDDLLRAFLWDALDFAARPATSNQLRPRVARSPAPGTAALRQAGVHASHPQPLSLPRRPAPDLLPHLPIRAVCGRPK